MEKVFIDTGAFYALADTSEGTNHTHAKSLFHETKFVWYSSNYVFDELATLLLYRTSKRIAIQFCEAIRASEKIVWFYLKEEDEQNGFELFRDFKDKEWSFTDCTTNILLKKHRIEKIFTFDKHFKQMGFVTV